jgi:hypothetical protein
LDLVELEVDVALRVGI